MPRSAKQSKTRSSKAANDVGILVGLIRTMAAQSTKACVMFQKSPAVFTQHSSEKNAEYTGRAVNGEWYKKHGKLHWVHSVFPPLAYPVRDTDGDWVTVGLQSLKQTWETLERDGAVAKDFRTVTTEAAEAGVIKSSWSRSGNRSYLSFAVTADLPKLESSSGASEKSKLSSSDLLKLIRSNM